MSFTKLISGILLAVLAVFGSHYVVSNMNMSDSGKESASSSIYSNQQSAVATVTAEQSEKGSTTATSSTLSDTKNSTKTYAKVYTSAELLAMADNKYADGSVPLGDYKYVTDAPKKGYVYLCNVHKDNPGSQVTGTWVHGDTWNFLQKITVSGSVSWKDAVFSNTLSGISRLLIGNDLPVGFTTGIFPVQSTDSAYKFDSNPNTISSQVLKKTLPASPVYLDSPQCMGGEVGVMNDGVALFNAFDAGLRDAPAHELQDSCDGHPQGSGEYHYHSLPSCFKDTSVQTVLGFALDGFPITGPKVAKDKYLTTEDLDVCHGIVSEVLLDGKKTATYHYVMTKDFPYSASCFRGKLSSLMVIGQGGGQMSPQMSGQNSRMQSSGQNNMQNQPMAGGGQNGQQPPQEAIDACSGKSQGSPCSISTPQGDVSGICRTPPNSSLACVPN